MKLNGTANSKLYVPFSTLAKGATLDWKMSSSETSWGTGALERAAVVRADVRRHRFAEPVVADPAAGRLRPYER